MKLLRGQCLVGQKAFDLGMEELRGVKAEGLPKLMSEIALAAAMDGKGNAEDTITSGLEGAWTSTPAAWSHSYLANLYRFEWELTKSPAGAHQWIPKDGAGADTVPDAHIVGKSHAPIMFTTDLALKEDPIYAEISKRFLDNPKEFNKAFAEAWYKLTHRDIGPHVRLLGPEFPEPRLWQDPVPAVDHELINSQDIAQL